MIRKLSFGLLAASLVGACITPRPKQAEPDSISQSQQQEAYAVSSVPQASELPKTQVNLRSLFKQLLVQDEGLSAEQVAAVAQISDPGRQTFEEALVALYSLNESIVYDKPLEQAIAQSKIDLAAAFRDNPLLKRFEAQAKCLRALGIAENSSEFTKTMKTALAENLKRWVSLARAGGFTSEAGTWTFGEDPAAIVDTESSSPKPIAEGYGGLVVADSILMDAQRLADKGLFSQAIARATEIDDQSPLARAAHEQIKLYSNSAVQVLRRKAARAYQSAAPLPDADAKLEYLKKAQQYLETALADFPEADQRDVVYENLEVIKAARNRLGE